MLTWHSQTTYDLQLSRSLILRIDWVNFSNFQPEKSSKKKLFGDDHSSSSNYSSLQKSRSNVTTLERKESKSPRPLVQPKSTKKTTPEMHLKAHLQLPIEEVMEKSPKIAEQNQNNANIEIMEEIRGIDEVDLRKKPEVKKREKKMPELNRIGSDIRRDVNGIPLELPEHMLETSNYAKRNRKSDLDAPTRNGFTLGASKAFEDLSVLGTESYTSDSEDERNNVSVNTIELNSSDVVVHQMEDEERKSRKTASTGDLTKMKKTTRSNTGTLERAQSLDITDTSGPSLGKSQAYDARENLLIDREPRLSLILDGLNTFQKDRLKNSREWGNLEDAILSPDEEERRKSEPQFNAVMDRVIQIKRESQEIELPEEVARDLTAKKVQQEVMVVNKLWPDEEELKPPVPERTKLKVVQPTVEYQCLKPTPPKREDTTVINLNEKPPVTNFEKHHITEMCSQLAKGRNGDCKMIKDEWEVDNLNNTSPPGSLMEEVLDSYNKSYNNVTVVQTNLPDETKRVQNVTEDFILNERNAASEGLINIPDDIKAAQKTDLHSLELSINNAQESNDFSVILSKPDGVTVGIVETFNSLLSDTPKEDSFEVEITQNQYSTFKGIEDESPALSLTDIPPQNYVTEIHVSEVTVVNQNDDPLDNAFENYVKTFESNLEDTIPEAPPILQKQLSDVEKQVSKIQELAEEQLKTLPEMRFTTSSYETSSSKPPEKRHSFELLRSSFEKASGSPPRRGSITPPKSRIPIATTMKTPPMSPERRDSRNLENENDTALLELVSKIKPPGKSVNVSVTSIRNNSKIPSGLPTLASRPPIPPRRSEDLNGGVESSFKQWVFSPSNNVTNVTVGKEK